MHVYLAIYVIESVSDKLFFMLDTRPGLAAIVPADLTSPFPWVVARD
jgi:hypothetical protein